MKRTPLNIILILTLCGTTLGASSEFTFGYLSKGKGSFADLNRSDAKLLVFEGKIDEDENRIDLYIEKVNQKLSNRVRDLPSLPSKQFSLKKVGGGFSLSVPDGVDQSEFRRAAATLKVLFNSHLLMTRTEKSEDEVSSFSKTILTSKDMGYSDLGDVEHPAYSVNLFADDEKHYFLKRKEHLGIFFIGDSASMGEYIDPTGYMKKWDMGDFEELLNRLLSHRRGISLSIVRIEMDE